MLRNGKYLKVDGEGKRRSEDTGEGEDSMKVIS
jgi:hypothetical protein